MKLQILVPQYKETEEIIRPLLDSLAIQQNVDFNEFSVIICNDGTDVRLREDFLNSYPYKIDYYLCPHQGVSGTRNECLRRATADYVMFCDADDMFFHACGLFMIFREIDIGFDSLISCFIEEAHPMNQKGIVYVDHKNDGTFVHGKVHRLQYLRDNNIEWNPQLTIHEDSYFHALCHNCGGEVKYLPTSFYLWRWRPDSVCREDKKYLLKTYQHLIESMDMLISQFILRNNLTAAYKYVCSVYYNLYFLLNMADWVNPENIQYKLTVELRFKKFKEKYGYLFDAAPVDVKCATIKEVKNKKFDDGLYLESITFDQWIQHIDLLKEENN